MGDNKKIRPAEKSTTVTKVLCAGLYGLDTTKCCSKDQSSEKVANVLLPVAYGLYSIDNRLPIPLCNSRRQLAPFLERISISDNSKK